MTNDHHEKDNSHDDEAIYDNNYNYHDDNDGNGNFADMALC